MLFRSVLASQTAGDYLLVTNPAEWSTTSTTYVKLKETKVGVGGTFRIKFSLAKDASLAYGQIYRNGAAVGTEQSTSSVYPTFVEFSEDIGGWSPGDLIQVYVKRSGGTISYVKDLDIYTAAPPIAGGHVSY